jgi:hypothetical protein
MLAADSTLWTLSYNILAHPTLDLRLSTLPTPEKCIICPYLSPMFHGTVFRLLRMGHSCKIIQVMYSSMKTRFSQSDCNATTAYIWPNFVLNKELSCSFDVRPGSVISFVHIPWVPCEVSTASHRTTRLLLRSLVKCPTSAMQGSALCSVGRPAVNPRQRQRIFHLASASTSALVPTQPLSSGYRGSFPELKRGRFVTLTTHPHLVPRPRMSRSYTSSPPSASMACSGTALAL